MRVGEEGWKEGKDNDLSARSYIFFRAWTTPRFERAVATAPPTGTTFNAAS